MKIEVNITKTRFYVLLGAILTLAVAIFVGAQVQTVPNPGHSVSQVAFDSDIASRVKILDEVLEIKGVIPSSPSLPTDGIYISAQGLRLNRDVGTVLQNNPEGVGIKISRNQPAIAVRNNHEVNGPNGNQDDNYQTPNGAALQIEAGKFCLDNRCIGDLTGVVIGGGNEVGAPPTGCSAWGTGPTCSSSNVLNCPTGTTRQLTGSVVAGAVTTRYFVCAIQ